MTASERIREARSAKNAETRKCYCPGDCNCRYQSSPWNRPNYCGCKEHGAVKRVSWDS